MSGNVYAFNRRSVEDQVIYVRAQSHQEAWEKARRDDAFDTSDVWVVSTTYRRLPEQDGAA